jgi:hypothetical protein
MNIYRYTFQRSCPVDGAVIDYSLELRTSVAMRAEAIVAACLGGPVLHEELADKLAAEFGGAQRMVATHGGVQIETLRP